MNAAQEFEQRKLALLAGLLGEVHGHKHRGGAMGTLYQAIEALREQLWHVLSEQQQRECQWADAYSRDPLVHAYKELVNVVLYAYHEAADAAQ
jgi:hypothetical protein